MRLSIIDYNRGNCPKNITEGLNLCTIYSRKDIVNYLEENKGDIHKVNANGYVFGFCEKEYQKDNQKRINEI